MPLIDQHLWVLHPDRLAGPQWRYCRIVVDSPAQDQPLVVRVHVTPRADGDDIHTLFESRGFRACLDRLLCRAIQDHYCHHAYSSYWSADKTQFSLLFATNSRGVDARDPHQPFLTYTFGATKPEPLLALSQHALLEIHARMRAIAQEQHAHRAATTGL